MGYSLYTYIGPAIRVNRKTRPIPTQLIACSNENCPNSKFTQRGNFCPLCGSPVTDRTVEEVREVGLYDFLDDKSGRYKKWWDFLTAQTEFDKENVWIPNQGPKSMYTYHGRGEDKTIYTKNVDTQKQIETFEAYFAEMLNDMREFGLVFETVYVVKFYSS